MKAFSGLLRDALIQALYRLLYARIPGARNQAQRLDEFRHLKLNLSEYRCYKLLDEQTSCFEG